jgi:hypothetical protein
VRLLGCPVAVMQCIQIQDPVKLINSREISEQI